MRYILNDGRLIQGDNVTTFSSNVICTVRDLTDDQRTEFIKQEVVEDPMPDTSYGYANEDPENPGKWIFTPYDSDRLKSLLIVYAATCRFNKETGGTMFNGSFVPTGRDDQVQYGLAQVLATVNPNISIQWKMYDADGNASFVTLDANAITAIGSAVGQWVQACFALEADTVSSIQDGSITTYTDVAKAFA